MILTCQDMGAQPTGREKIYLEITDMRDTLDFSKCFSRNESGSKRQLKINGYVLMDASETATGFQLYLGNKYIYLRQAWQNKRILIVKDRTDTMSIEIVQPRGVYFLHIPFQKGQYTLYIGKDKLHKWNYHTIPYKRVSSQEFVFDISPVHWSLLEVNKNKTDLDYSISKQLFRTDTGQIQAKIMRTYNQNLQVKNSNGYTFTYNKSPLTNCPECHGCYCYLFTVLDSDSNMLFNQVFQFQENNIFYTPADSFEVADYNFDGVPDFRFCIDSLKHSYFVYDQKNKQYVPEPLLNQFDHIEFYYDAKTLIADKLIFSLSDSLKQPNGIINRTIDSQSRYVLSGKGLSHAKENHKKFIHTPDGIRAENETNYYRYSNFQLIPISEVEYNECAKKLIINEVIKFSTPFKFVLSKNIPDIELPAEKGYYANKISVYDTKTDTLIYTIVTVGNYLKQSLSCPDSLQVADYNFDGFPDIRICNNSVKDKHMYYLYSPDKSTFILERTLTELHSLTFDFELKIAKGKSDRKEHKDMLWNNLPQYYTEELIFQGKGLENLTVITNSSGITQTFRATYIKQKRVYEGDSIGLKLLTKKSLIRSVSQFKFEMVFNTEEYNPDSERGAYVRTLNISYKEQSFGPYLIYGNYLKEVPHWQDSLEIADYNFDGFPDIRIYNSVLNDRRYIYMLYNPEIKGGTFYQESLFSLSRDLEFIPKRKMIIGSVSETNQTLYFVLRNDTLTLTKQPRDPSKQVFIEESIYRYGVRKSLRAAYDRLDPILKIEQGDYNFDGYEDFRQQDKNGWVVFLYNPLKSSYEKNELLSKFEQFDYNPYSLKMEGYFSEKTDELTRHWWYYRWSFSQMKMIVYQEKICTYRSPSSESCSCIIHKIVDGKVIDRTEFGAE
jgi:hypothetical protein